MNGWQHLQWQRTPQSESVSTTTRTTDADATEALAESCRSQLQVHCPGQQGSSPVAPGMGITEQVQVCTVCMCGYTRARVQSGKHCALLTSRVPPAALPSPEAHQHQTP
eukprot:GHRQ01028320.1.p2 GENE.GHRQ01028320.1~~GHRQ01028320.1.p2  ORF type:complete len:109 (-),score=6.64 GHRQ01028320.1:418-744(-)